MALIITMGLHFTIDIIAEAKRSPRKHRKDLALLEGVPGSSMVID